MYIMIPHVHSSCMQSKLLSLQTYTHFRTAVFSNEWDSYTYYCTILSPPPTLSQILSMSLSCLCIWLLQVPENTVQNMNIRPVNVLATNSISHFPPSCVYYLLHVYALTHQLSKESYVHTTLTHTHTHTHTHIHTPHTENPPIACMDQWLLFSKT